MCACVYIYICMHVVYWQWGKWRLGGSDSLTPVRPDQSRRSGGASAGLLGGGDGSGSESEKAAAAAAATGGTLPACPSSCDALSGRLHDLLPYSLASPLADSWYLPKTWNPKDIYPTGMLGSFCKNSELGKII